MNFFEESAGKESSGMLVIKFAKSRRVVVGF